jgi:hypothetical protein
VRQLVLLDLTKLHQEKLASLSEFSKLYDLVKNDRNKYVHLIQASGQGLAEMKEKMKILHNEVRQARCWARRAVLYRARCAVPGGRVAAVRYVSRDATDMERPCNGHSERV